MKLNSEANTQAELYHQARRIGLEVALEVVTPFGRLDLVVLSECRKSLHAIVEVKRTMFAGVGTQQLLRYKQIGVPVHLFHEFGKAAEMASWLKAKYQGSASIPLDAIAKMVNNLPRGRRYRYYDLNIK